MGSIPAIVLAAGSSLRLGSAKQLARLGAETLLERAARTALEAELSPVYGVVSADLLIESPPRQLIRVVNHEATEGMASSIRAGLRALGHADAALGVVILACDQPAVTARHLRELANGGSEVVASAYSGRKGVPAYFPNAVFEMLLNLRGDRGARDLLQNARAIPLQGGELDIDTIEDLEQARKLYSTCA
jgi:molybdenum cofactor cytidylyltransferase